jgi:1-acyl-sn-glycerol-3-phosphate acyltransferase
VVWRRIAWELLRGGPFERLVRAGAVWVSLGQVIRVHGRRRVAREGGLVVFPTHGADLDFSELVYAIPRPLRVVASIRTQGHAIQALLLRLRGCYLLERSELSATTTTLEALDRAAHDARAGAVVLMFPQGVRRRIQSGAPWLAARAGVPVLPVFCHRVAMRGACSRVVIWIRRPIAPPSMRSSDRRAFGERLQQRMDGAGASRGDRALMDVVLDDRELSRDPRRVVRASARVQRLPEPARRQLARRARLLRRATRRLRCSPDWLRTPPGWVEMLSCLVAAPLAVVGLALCAPPWIFGFLIASREKVGRRVARNRVGMACAVPWALVLLAVGIGGWGWAGLLLPMAAGIGLFAVGLLKRWGRAVCALPLIHRYRARFLPHLDAIRRGLDGRPPAPASS